MVVIGEWDVQLSKDEMAALMLRPEYGILDRLNDEQYEVEIQSTSG